MGLLSMRIETSPIWAGYLSSRHTTYERSRPLHKLSINTNTLHRSHMHKRRLLCRICSMNQRTPCSFATTLEATEHQSLNQSFDSRGCSWARPTAGNPRSEFSPDQRFRCRKRLGLTNTARSRSVAGLTAPGSPPLVQQFRGECPPAQLQLERSLPYRSLQVTSATAVPCAAVQGPPSRSPKDSEHPRSPPWTVRDAHRLCQTLHANQPRRANHAHRASLVRGATPRPLLADAGSSASLSPLEESPDLEDQRRQHPCNRQLHGHSSKGPARPDLAALLRNRCHTRRVRQNEH